jgi:hypothetical protein
MAFVIFLGDARLNPYRVGSVGYEWCTRSYPDF